MMNQTLQELGEYIKSAVPDAVLAVMQDQDELILLCKLELNVRLLTLLRDDANCLFKILVDI